MTIKPFLFLGLTSTLLLTGCGSSPVKSNGKTFPQVPATALITPSVKAFPVQAPQPTPNYHLQTETPQPIWNPTVISRIEVDAYVDEKGRLFPPTSMYVIRKQGGWNLDAVRGNTGYVPPENSIKPYDMPGTEWGTTAVVANPQNLPSPVELDISKAKLTGIVDKNAEQAARSLAGQNEVAVYDGRFGWVIVKQSDVAAGFDIEKPRPPSDYQKVTPPPATPSTNNRPNTTAPATNSQGPVFQDL